jgi:hypothetical protein
MIMSPEPVVIACWAAALYATVRAAEGGSRIWWAGLGLTTGAGLLAGYGMIAFVAGLAGYGLLSARGRDWTGAGIAAAVALVVVAPTLAWSAGHGGAALAGAIGDLQPGQGDFRLRGLAVFVAAQVALIGPVFLVAIGLALRNAGVWRDDWGMRLMAWVTAPLLLATTACALAVPTPPGWAAPAYVGGALMAARWLVLAGGLPALRAQIAVGVAASLALWGAAGLYAGNAEALTRRLDPFREMRLAEPYCELVLGVMAEEGVGVMLSDDRRRLSECMFYGGLGWDEVAVWNPDRRPDTHHELMATLYPGDAREMLLVVRQDARRFTRHFAEAREVETGAIETHKDRSVPFSIWVVQGFKGY